MANLLKLPTGGPTRDLTLKLGFMGEAVGWQKDVGLLRSRGVLLRKLKFSAMATWTAGIFLILALTFGILAYRNFPAGIVLITILLPSAVPLFFLLRSGPDLGDAESKRARRSAPLWGLGGGVFLLVFLLSALDRWSSHFSNFANTRFEQGIQFDKDTAFHVAIIRSIQNHGYPSTGQHESELLWYHVLSHYVDAGWTALLGLDPWGSYALLFYAKAIVLLLSLLVFVSKVAGDNPYVFATLLAVSTPALTNSWHAVGSFGQWVPFVILFLVASWVVKTLRADSVKVGALVGLTMLVFLLSVGKISLGFGFACIVGLWLVFKRSGDLRIYLTGALWLLFFVLWFVQSSRLEGPDVPLLERLSPSWPDVGSLVGVTLVALVFWLVTKEKDWGVLLSVLLTVGAIYVSIPLFVVTSSGSDVYYFLHGLYSVIALVFFAVLAGSFSSNQGLPSTKRPQLKEFVPYVALLGAFLIPLLPTIAKSPVVAGFSPEQGYRNVYSATASTYKWPSRALSNEHYWSVLEEVPDQDLTELENATFLSRLQDAVDRELYKEGIQKSSALLFLSKEGWEEIEASYEVSRPWATGLLLKAVTGMTLVHSLSPDRPVTYGFADYTADGLRISEERILDSTLCRFGKPVLVIENPVTEMTVSVRCQ